jgi:hypothetical protein
MKSFLTFAAALVMTYTAVAQPPQGRGPQGPDGERFRPQFVQKDPAQIAQEQTDNLNELVGLTPKQYKKIYKFNKKQAQERQDAMSDMMPQGRPEGFPGGMGPGMGGGRPERPPMGQGRPDGMGPGGPGGPRGDGQFRPGPRNEEMQKLMENQREKRMKQYGKILTEEQYRKWEAAEAEREFRQAFEKP